MHWSSQNCQQRSCSFTRRSTDHAKYCDTEKRFTKAGNAQKIEDIETVIAQKFIYFAFDFKW